MTHLILSVQEPLSSAATVELRCDDSIPHIDSPPFILTSNRLELIESLAALTPAYLDIPAHAPFELFTSVRTKFPNQKIIASFHDYAKTPHDLGSIYNELRKLPCDVIKIVTHAESSLDGLRMLAFLQKMSGTFPLTAFCMGEKGTFTRILQPLYGSFSSYSCLDNQQTAPGQLSHTDMEHIYRFSTLSPSTRPYALIGKPLDHSLGHLLHNATFSRMGQDAIYVKIELEKHEAHTALSYFETLGFQGLSITMPLKQAFFEKPYNTAVRKHNRWDFHNTDGSGALDYLGNVENKSMLIHGAGATAEAIGEEAIRRGAAVFIHNRTYEKAEILAKKIGAKPVQELISADCIVNATPAPVAGPVLLDVNNKTSSGQGMWLRQGAKQQALWHACHNPLHLPPSKSQTLRAILFASLATGISTIENPLESPDTEAMIAACKAIGADISQHNNTLSIQGIGSKRALSASTLDAGNSGIVLRFMGAIGALFTTPFTLSGDASMLSRRSCRALIDGLTQLGASVTSQNGHAPLTIQGPIRPGTAHIAGEDSQPVSALLIAASLLNAPTRIIVHNGGERPWVELTLDWLRRQKVIIEEETPWTFVVHPVDSFSPFIYRVPGDLSQLSYLVAAALITPGTTLIHDVNLQDLQGDKIILTILQKMGAIFSTQGTTLSIQGPQILHGIDVDINDCIDMVTILATLSCYATGTTTIRGASIARDKESNRLASMTEELQKMGASIQETSDGLIIQHSPLHGAALTSHNDHRVAMALAIASLFAKGPSTISQTDCIKKTYARFFLDLERFL